MPNFQAGVQTLFNIRLRPILLKSASSIFIWYPNVPCYLFSVTDRDIKRTARRIVWEEMLINIRQATFCSLYVHFCRHFIHHVYICIHWMHTLLFSARGVI